jgi:hypothetical protein
MDGVEMGLFVDTPCLEVQTVLFINLISAHFSFFLWVIVHAHHRHKEAATTRWPSSSANIWLHVLFMFI